MKGRRRFLILPVTTVLIIVALHLYLLDGLVGWTLATFYQDDTVYAQQYTDHRFRRLTTGVDEGAVLGLLGPPLGEVWAFERHGDLLRIHVGQSGRVESVIGPRRASYERELLGSDREAMLRDLGQPYWKSWIYTKSANDSSYRIRVVHFREGRVARVIHEYYLD